MEYIRNKQKKQLIKLIEFDEYKFQQNIFQRIVEDKHKFKYSWNKFGASESLELIQYVSDQNDNWIFDKKELDKLFNVFDGKFSKNKLREKVLSLGIDFHFE